MRMFGLLLTMSIFSQVSEDLGMSDPRVYLYFGGGAGFAVFMSWQAVKLQKHFIDYYRTENVEQRTEIEGLHTELEEVRKTAIAAQDENVRLKGEVQQWKFKYEQLQDRFERLERRFNDYVRRPEQPPTAP